MLRALGCWLTRPLSPLPLLAVLAVIGVFGSLAERSRSRWDPGRTAYDRAIRRAAEAHMPQGWDWRIMKAMVQQESQFKAAAVSPAGARGLCQIMPDTARDLGIDPARLSDPDTSIDAAARYLRWLWDGWPDLEDRPPRWLRSRLAIASYNAGPSRIREAVEDAGGRPSWRAVARHVPRETRRHIEVVFEENYPRLRRLHTGSAAGVSRLARSRSD
jgi:soluble lytic murein transglycosylase-like protein